MQTITEDAVLQKTRELCQALLEQPEFQKARRSIDTFMNNPEAKAQYQQLTEQGEYLHHKQHQGVQLTESEIASFDKLRESFFKNPVAKGFMDSQQAVHKMQETVGQYVGKTYELGRVPEAEDFDSGSCGPSCGCGH